MTLPRPVRVLIADDQRVVRDGLSLIIGLLDGIEVIDAVSDGLQAVRQATSGHPDVVLMDLHMPGCDGIEATRRIHREVPGVHVLVLSTYCDDVDLLPALKAGAEGYLTKDATAEEIHRAILDVAAGRTHLDATIQQRLVATVLTSPLHQTRPEGSARPLPDGLTTREVEVLRMIARGLSNSEISRDLVLSGATVKTHINHIFAKTGVRDRGQAVRYAYQNNLVS
jgi:DNA-binding NarL/FixJ family response regulator